MKDLKKLEISFTVPDMEEHWESKPPRILSHLIGHEGSGSLLAHLKNWAGPMSYLLVGILCPKEMLFLLSI